MKSITEVQKADRLCSRIGANDGRVIQGYNRYVMFEEACLAADSSTIM